MRTECAPAGRENNAKPRHLLLEEERDPPPENVRRPHPTAQLPVAITHPPFPHQPRPHRLGRTTRPPNPEVARGAYCPLVCGAHPSVAATHGAKKKNSCGRFSPTRAGGTNNTHNTRLRISHFAPGAETSKQMVLRSSWAHRSGRAFRVGALASRPACVCVCVGTPCPVQYK